jgi:hypothetical protein
MTGRAAHPRPTAQPQLSPGLRPSITCTTAAQPLHPATRSLQPLLVGRVLDPSATLKPPTQRLLSTGILTETSARRPGELPAFKIPDHYVIAVRTPTERTNNTAAII